jgi:predicted CopG family antitoxin
MNKTALKKHEIYRKLSEITEQDLSSISDYIDTIRQKKKLGAGSILRLQGVLKDKNIDLADLKAFKKETWKHVEEEHE